MERRFNIRVYGIWLHQGRVLVNEEIIRNKKIVKFPGGGLEFGEGIHDCLRREWLEELGLDVTILSHYYTTDFFQPSAYDDSQIISIYYLVSADPNIPIANLNHNERTFWIALNELTPETFTLPIDRVVGQMLIENRGSAM